jgi:hypothetical protein
MKRRSICHITFFWWQAVQRTVFWKPVFKKTIVCWKLPHIRSLSQLRKTFQFSGQYQQKSVFCFEGAYLFWWKTICLNRLYWLLNSFIGSYEQLQKNTQRGFKLEAEIEGSIKYQSDRILNLQIKHYLHRRRSWLSRTAFLLFNPASGNPSQHNCLKTGFF